MNGSEKLFSLDAEERRSRGLGMFHLSQKAVAVQGEVLASSVASPTCGDLLLRFPTQALN